MNLVEGKTGKWEVVIGLEIHAQVVSESKLFSGASTKFGGGPNTQVSVVDAAMPGMLPVLNEQCVVQAIKTGLGLNAKINKVSAFDRKNYFYADLPQGYQISQFYHPIVGEGVLEIDLDENNTKSVRIERIHLEQDAGKSIHDQSPTESFIDLNRSGIALMEIVTKPDLRSANEAAEFIKKLRNILRYLGTCDGDMEKGSLRCDANVSIRKPGGELGTRCEIKNLNSTKNLMKAVEYEVERQISVLESSGQIAQETRLFDTNLSETRSMRSKEDAFDYRYFPDPDLLPIEISDEYINEIRARLPELPDHKKKRYISEFSLSNYDASILSSDKDIAQFFEEVISGIGNKKLAANWILVELFGRLNKLSMKLSDSKVSSCDMVDLLQLIENNTISGKIAKDVLDIMFETGKKADVVVEEKGLKQITDTSSIEHIIKDVLSSNADKVAEYKSGKDKLFGFFVGQIMKQSGGKVNPQMLNELLKKYLN
ncbi:MAG: Asp-tRNA(Asn)/Glu-tRNA(Gln) amidotransferase subunit GatB [Rickettsiales bacterium]|nr:Asp-tRNA(Asn)/Glu-tRNA(Gln) amidotransferase subunit GatB [Rickettsiales bacterium]